MNFQNIFEKTFRHLHAEFKDQVVIDLPAGEGLTSKWLYEAGAKVYPFDLFPQFFKFNQLQCQACDLSEKIPLQDSFADVIISQEGIEHIPNQLNAFAEFSRVLKMNGRLILTSPNGSSLTSKISRLLNESEKYGRILPANLVDSIWFNSEQSDKMYFGHLFIPTVTELRVFARIMGLDLQKIYFSELKISNLFWFILLYPFILIFQLKNYLRNSRKNPGAAAEYKKVFLLSIHPAALLDGSLVLEFQKIQEPRQAQEKLRHTWSEIQKNRP